MSAEAGDEPPCGVDAGTIALGKKMLNITTDYLTAHAILGVQRLSTCVAVPVVTAAKAVATLGSDTVFQVKGSKVLTANGRPPMDPGDVRCSFPGALSFFIFRSVWWEGAPPRISRTHPALQNSKAFGWFFVRIMTDWTPEFSLTFSTCDRPSGLALSSSAVL
jgi:hypothetical protein